MVAISINFIFFYFWPFIAEAYWHRSQNFMEVNSISISVFYIVHGTVLGWIVSVIWQLIFWLIYHLKWDCFERYKVLEDSWPWESDPDTWASFLIKIFRLSSLNSSPKVHLICSRVPSKTEKIFSIQLRLSTQV